MRTGHSRFAFFVPIAALDSSGTKGAVLDVVGNGIDRRASKEL